MLDVGGTGCQLKLKQRFRNRTARRSSALSFHSQPNIVEPERSDRIRFMNNFDPALFDKYIQRAFGEFWQREESLPIPDSLPC